MALESMTHLEDKDTRHEVELPNLAIVVIEKLVGFNDTLYWENYANSLANIETVFSEDEVTIGC